MIDGAPAGDHTDPSGKGGRLPQRMQRRPRVQEHVLRQIAGVLRPDAREHQPVHESAEAPIDLVVRDRVTSLGRDHEFTDVGAGLARGICNQKLPVGSSRMT